MANNITTASALFETFQNIMQGRKVAAREQNRAVQAMILQGMLNEVLNQRQLLRQEQSQLNVVERQGKYNLMQTLISKKADLTKERMKIESDLQTGTIKTIQDREVLVNKRGEILVDYGEKKEEPKVVAKPHPTKPDYEILYQKGTDIVVGERPVGTRPSSIEKMVQYDIYKSEVRPIDEEMKQLTENKLKHMESLESGFREITIDEIEMLGGVKAIEKEGRTLVRTELGKFAISLTDEERRMIKLTTAKLDMRLADLQREKEEIAKQYGIVDSEQEKQPSSLNLGRP